MVLTGLMIVQESCELVAEAGYMIACEFSGKSLATDSLAVLLALPELSTISRYQAVVTDGNKALVSVLEKMGLSLQTLLKITTLLEELSLMTVFIHWKDELRQ